MQFIQDFKLYKEFDINAFSFLNSYINTDAFRNKEDVITNKLPYKLDLMKTRNTIAIISFYACNNPAIYNLNAALRYRVYGNLLEMCCKAVCQKYKYKYLKSYYCKVGWFIWGTTAWNKCCINMVELCEIVYHIKNRKYAKLYNTLLNLEFRNVEYSCVYDTVKFLTDYANYEANITYKAVFACLIYMYLNVYNNFEKFPNRFQIIASEKASEHVAKINVLTQFPLYLRHFMIEQISQKIKN